MRAISDFDFEGVVKLTRFLSIPFYFKEGLLDSCWDGKPSQIGEMTGEKDKLLNVMSSTM